jgi:hypothetical protein
MLKGFATVTAGLALALVTVGSPADAATSHPKPAVVTVSKVTKAVKVCTGAPVARRDIASCVNLYLRPASWTEHHRVYNPAGSALVAECLDQYRGVELHYCLTQPIEK